jgi:hypothetical protein
MTTDELYAMWRNQYQMLRYLEGKKTEELQERLRDIALNRSYISQDGQYQLKQQKDLWAEKHVHVFEEARMSRLTLSEPDLPHYANAARAAELWRTVNLPPQTYLLKFGQRSHMRNFYYKGAIHLSPAGRYLYKSLSPAIRDNEREFTQESRTAKVSTLMNRGRLLRPEERQPIPLIGPLQTKRTYGTDFYLYCMSRAYDSRLFEDFSRDGDSTYDTCVVVKDWERFINVLCGGTKKYLPDWDMSFGDIIYSDPCFPREGRVNDVLYTKHFRFTYQQEFRFAWVPPNAIEGLNPLDFEIGPMSDYCALLEL